MHFVGFFCHYWKCTVQKTKETLYLQNKDRQSGCDAMSLVGVSDVSTKPSAFTFKHTASNPRRPEISGANVKVWHTAVLVECMMTEIQPARAQMYCSDCGYMFRLTRGYSKLVTCVLTAHISVTAHSATATALSPHLPLFWHDSLCSLHELDLTAGSRLDLAAPQGDANSKHRLDRDRRSTSAIGLGSTKGAVGKMNMLQHHSGYYNSH